MAEREIPPTADALRNAIHRLTCAASGLQLQCMMAKNRMRAFLGAEGPIGPGWDCVFLSDGKMVWHPAKGGITDRVWECHYGRALEASEIVDSHDRWWIRQLRQMFDRLRGFWLAWHDCQSKLDELDHELVPILEAVNGKIAWRERVRKEMDWLGEWCYFSGNVAFTPEEPDVGMVISSIQENGLPEWDEPLRRLHQYKAELQTLRRPTESRLQHMMHVEALHQLTEEQLTIFRRVIPDFDLNNINHWQILEARCGSKDWDAASTPQFLATVLRQRRILELAHSEPRESPNSTNNPGAVDVPQDAKTVNADGMSKGSNERALGATDENEKGGTNDFLEIAKWASANLKGKQRRTVELLTENSGVSKLADLAPALEWEPPYDGAAGGIQTALNKKLKKLGWSISRQDSEFRLSKTIKSEPS